MIFEISITLVAVGIFIFYDNIANNLLLKYIGSMFIYSFNFFIYFSKRYFELIKKFYTIYRYFPLVYCFPRVFQFCFFSYYLFKPLWTVYLVLSVYSSAFQFIYFTILMIFKSKNVSITIVTKPQLKYILSFLFLVIFQYSKFSWYLCLLIFFIDYVQIQHKKKIIKNLEESTATNLRKMNLNIQSSKTTRQELENLHDYYAKNFHKININFSDDTKLKVTQFLRSGSHVSYTELFDYSNYLQFHSKLYKP